MGRITFGRSKQDRAYQYSPLPSHQSFRLLRKLPSTNADPATFTIDTFDVNDTSLPEYNALSHTWGTTGRMVPIIVDGKQLLITPNLSEAMTRLEEVHQRDQAFKQLWWIDMICINQDDILERGHQVAMMRTIIRTASLVVAWVGPDLG